MKGKPVNSSGLGITQYVQADSGVFPIVGVDQRQQKSDLLANFLFWHGNLRNHPKIYEAFSENSHNNICSSVGLVGSEFSDWFNKTKNPFDFSTEVQNGALPFSHAKIKNFLNIQNH